LLFPMGTKTQNLKTHFVDVFGAVSRNAAPSVPSGRPSKHYIFAFALALVEFGLLFVYRYKDSHMQYSEASMASAVFSGI